MRDGIKLLYNRYPHLPLKDRMHMYFRIKTIPWKLILEYFPHGENMIDIGCGHGAFINLLDMRDRGYKKFTGLDFAVDKIKTAKLSENNHIFFLETDIFDIKEGAGTYSILDVLYLIPYSLQDKLIKHIYDILPFGGFLIIKEIDKKPLWKFFITVIQESITVKILHLTKGKKFYFRTESEFRKLFAGAGFKTRVEYLHTGYLYPHILYICQK